MAAVEILFFDERDDGVAVIPFRLDATEQEMHRIDVQITDHEVESGVNVTDHARRQSSPLTLNVIVTAASLLDDPSPSPSRLADAWEALEDAAGRSLLALITTSRKSYEDVLLMSVMSSKTAADGTWMKAELTFKPIRFVQTQLVADPVPARARDRRQVDRGAQGTEEDRPDRMASALTQLGRAGGWDPTEFIQGVGR